MNRIPAEILTLLDAALACGDSGAMAAACWAYAAAVYDSDPEQHDTIATILRQRDIHHEMRPRPICHDVPAYVVACGQLRCAACGEPLDETGYHMLRLSSDAREARLTLLQHVGTWEDLQAAAERYAVLVLGDGATVTQTREVEVPLWAVAPDHFRVMDHTTGWVYIVNMTPPVGVTHWDCRAELAKAVDDIQRSVADAEAEEAG